MADEEVPKRRPTDPKPGTKGPPRGSNDAFTQKMPKAPAPEPVEPKPFEGWLARERRVTRDKIIEDAVNGTPRFKHGGLVRGWGKARVKR
jgi:hypothetical protein